MGREHGADDKKSVLDYAPLTGQRVAVKLLGGREVSGVLRGFDSVSNLILDEAVETLKDSTDPTRTRDRTLGLTVARGTSVICVFPVDGFEEIANPFKGEEEE